MDSRRAAGRLSERGMTSVQFLLASALGLVLFLTLANIVVVQYGRGAIRSALEQGARVGAITGSVARCETRVDDVLSQLLGGQMGVGIAARCTVSATVVRASGVGSFRSWTPLSPDFGVDIQALATREILP
jgi:hypothetical protein